MTPEEILDSIKQILSLVDSVTAETRDLGFNVIALEMEDAQASLVRARYAARRAVIDGR